MAGMAAVMRKMEESSVRTRPRGSILQMGGGWKWNWMRALLDGDSMSRREQMLKTPHSDKKFSAENVTEFEGCENFIFGRKLGGQ